MDLGSILKTKGSEVSTSESDTPVAEIARALAQQKIGTIVICGADDKPLWIVSERDLVRGLAEEGIALLEKPVSTYMTHKLQTCAPTDSVARLMELMTSYRIRHLPVIEDARLCGIVSIGDVVKARLDEIEAEAEALRTYVATA